LHGDKEGGSGGQPLGAVLGEATTRDDIVHVGGVLELPSPSMQDACKTRKGSANETRVLGEAFEGARRGLEPGLVGEAWRRADTRAQGRRDGEGEEAVRPRELCVEVVLEPLLSLMVLTLRPMSMAA
jgi:hypothetical protein